MLASYIMQINLAIIIIKFKTEGDKTVSSSYIAYIVTKYKLLASLLYLYIVNMNSKDLSIVHPMYY